ncbi:MAG: hypothetical protein OXC14_18425 [Rhodospirillaceae bacterium]|nr:hypothetical protein [Rhodospirillaceae bacterium]
MRYTREEVQANRERWLEYLREEGRLKHVGSLENAEAPDERCCLGHGAHCLDAPRQVVGMDHHIVEYDGESSFLGDNVSELLNLHKSGQFHDTITIKGQVGEDDELIEFDNLTQVNDDTSLEPGEIADVIAEQFEKGNLCELWDFTNHAPTP